MNIPRLTIHWTTPVHLTLSQQASPPVTPPCHVNATAVGERL